MRAAEEIVAAYDEVAKASAACALKPWDEVRNRKLRRATDRFAVIANKHAYEVAKALLGALDAEAAR